MLSYFSTEQLRPLIPAVVLLSGAILFNQYRNEKISILLLFSGTLFLGIFIALLDPFLVLWDEQFHALVAKNMMQHPFKPMLYMNPVIDYNFRNWTLNHVWLHKQPLFLWQMALSMKLFGINILGLRFASALLHAIIPIFIYRIGKITVSSNTGFYGALFFAVAYFPLELVAGRFSTDHNDVAFIFYITGSFWAFVEYLRSENKKYLVLIGIFSGAAVLVKWLTGLVVFAPWFIVILSDHARRNNFRNYLAVAVSFLFAALVFLPWQIYILNTFPHESHYEFSQYTQHIYSSLEGHTGEWWYHFDAVRTIYGRGSLIPIILITASATYCLRVKEKAYRIFFISAILIIYAWFSLASTKMISYSAIVSPLVFLSIGSLADIILEKLKQLLKEMKNSYALLSNFLLVLISLLFLNTSRIENNHTMKKPLDNFNRELSLRQQNKIQKLAAEIPDSSYVIFNCDKFLNIPIMFFTGHIAYDFLPGEDQLLNLRNEGYKIAVMNADSLPSYIRRSDALILKY